jgi:radical SAM superfamily enzyme with C-terminal helix-hairpin-helix motif
MATERDGQSPLAGTCSFCTEKSVSAYLIREPIKDANKGQQVTKLRVVRVCATHREQVPK